MASPELPESCSSCVASLHEKIDQLTLALGQMKAQLTDAQSHLMVTGLQWRSLAVELPLFDEHDFDEHERVLIYTEGSDFNGEQIFDVPAVELWNAHGDQAGGTDEVITAATHWCTRPLPQKPVQPRVTRNGEGFVQWMA